MSVFGSGCGEAMRPILVDEMATLAMEAATLSRYPCCGDEVLYLTSNSCKYNRDRYGSMTLSSTSACKRSEG